MNTREHFKKQGLEVEWGKNKVVVKVGRDKEKIVCSPKAFRYFERAVKALNDIGYVDSLIEGELLDEQIRNSKRPDRFQRAATGEEKRSLRSFLHEAAEWEDEGDYPSYDDDGNLVPG